MLGVAAPGPDQQGDALEMVRESDADFSARFGIAELLAEAGDEGAPAAAAATAPAAPKRPAAPAAEGAPAAEQPRNERGQFTAAPAEGSVAAAQDAVVAGAMEDPDGLVSDPAGEEGEGAESAGAPAAKPKLATDFTVIQDGAEVEAPLDALIKFKAYEKEYELPLDKVVRLAKMGVYNEEKEQTHTATAERNVQLERFARELFSTSAQTEQFLALVLAGGEDADQILETARTKYAEENSPEAENRRLKAQIDELKRTNAAPKEGDGTVTPARQAALNVAATLTPQLDTLIAEHAAVIPAAEVWQRFDKLVTPYKNAEGQLDPRHYSRVLELASTALPVLLETLAEARQQQAGATADTNKELALTKGKLRLTKRTLATGARPAVGQPAPGSRTVATAPKAAPQNASPEAVNETFLENLANEIVAGAAH
jgi:hypothetical protein